MRFDAEDDAGAVSRQALTGDFNASFQQVTGGALDVGIGAEGSVWVTGTNQGYTGGMGPVGIRSMVPPYASP